MGRGAGGGLRGEGAKEVRKGHTGGGLPVGNRLGQLLIKALSAKFIVRE